MKQIHGKKCMIGTSGGINSAAVIVQAVKMIQAGIIPSELHLVYIALNEHSPDTHHFVDACVSYCKSVFPETIYHRVDASVLQFFDENKMIPHPKSDSCTRLLKTIPLAEYKAKYGIEVDLIGYVNSEKQRIKGIVSNVTGQNKGDVDANYYIEHGLSKGLFEAIFFPTANISDEDCFVLVKEAIGWHPYIYDILWTDPAIMDYANKMEGKMPEDARSIIIKYTTQGYGRGGSKRVFNHNNCLPCKNMQIWQFWLVGLFFPFYFDDAASLSKKINKYYGRNEKEYTDSIAIYTTFGREDYEVDFKEQTCGVCASDG